MEGNRRKLKEGLEQKGKHIASPEQHIMPERAELENLYVSANEVLDRLELVFDAGEGELAVYEKWLKEDGS